MTALLEFENGREAYPHVVRHVAKHGVVRKPRGESTLDAGHVTMVLNDPTDALPLGCGRNLSVEIAAAEAIQLIGGFSKPELLPPSFDRFKEPDGSFHGAYGPRVANVKWQGPNQLEKIVDRLKSDPYTRQAVLTIWDPVLDLTKNKHDYPCTVAMGFTLIEQRLELNVTMRSNDVWLGAPYDWFQFTQLQCTVANLLGVPPGPYRHTAWSLHLYERDFNKVEQLKYAPTADHTRFYPTGLGCYGETVPIVQNFARVVTSRTLRNPAPERMTDSEQWYADRMSDILEKSGS